MLHEQLHETWKHQKWQQVHLMSHLYCISHKDAMMLLYLGARERKRSKKPGDVEKREIERWYSCIAKILEKTCNWVCQGNIFCIMLKIWQKNQNEQYWTSLTVHSLAINGVTLLFSFCITHSPINLDSPYGALIACLTLAEHIFFLVLALCSILLVLVISCYIGCASKSWFRAWTDIKS